MLLVTLTGEQKSLKMQPTYITIQKSQPAFPNPEATYPGVGSNNKPHTHSNDIF